MFSRKPALEGPTATVQDSVKEPARSARWTNGSLLRSKLVGVLVLAMWFCGPLSWLVASNALTTARHANAAAHVGTAPTGLSTIDQSAGSFAVGFVGAWLSATADDSSALDAYVSNPPTTLPQTAFSYRNMAAASITPYSTSEMVTVVVGADVEQVQISGDGQTTSWPRRYFQVIVNTHGSALTAVTLPAPVAGPKTSTNTPNLGYRQTLSFDSSTAQMVTEFFTAYLTGQGTTEPFTAPAVSLPAITPAPYAHVTPVSYLATKTPDGSPSDGSTLGVLATITAQTATGQQLTATYVVQMLATSGRWQVKAIQAQPVVTSSSTPTSIPSPTTPSTGGSK